MRIEETVRPDPAAAATYAALLPLFAELYDALVPAFTSMRRLAPSLPAEPEPSGDRRCDPPAVGDPGQGASTPEIR